MSLHIVLYNVLLCVLHRTASYYLLFYDESSDAITDCTWYFAGLLRSVCVVRLYTIATMSSYTVRYRATWYLMRCNHSVMWCGVIRCCITLCQTTPTRPYQTLLRYTAQAVPRLTPPINATWFSTCDFVRCGSCLPCDHALHLHICMLSHWAVRLYYSALYDIVHSSGP